MGLEAAPQLQQSREGADVVICAVVAVAVIGIVLLILFMSGDDSGSY